MQRAGLFLVLGALAVSGSLVTPVQKVVDLMQKMVAKGKSEMEEESTQFATYVKFCENTTVEKGRAISEATEQISLLTARIEKAASDADQSATEIVELQHVIDSSSTEKTNAAEIREKDAAVFTATLKDYTDSITAIGRAKKMLTTGSHEQVSLVQLQNVYSSKKKISPTEASTYLDAFLEGAAGDEKVQPVDTSRSLESFLSEDEVPAVPQAAGYESKSGGIMGLLEQMEDQFKTERNSLRMDELKKKNAHATVLAALEAEIKDATTDKRRKEAQKAAVQQDKALDEAELTETQSALDADTKYKKDLEMDWKKKTAEFNARQKLRSEELEAVGKAVDIISGGAVAGSAEKHLPSLLQGQALAVMARRLRSPGLQQVAQLLQQRAEQLHSKELAALALRVTSDPIDKVKTMMEDMVKKLQEQLDAETTKKAWCDEELKTNEASRSEKSDTAEGMRAEVDKIEATIKQLGDELTLLSSQLTETKASMSKASELRQKEKAENTQAIADAKAAQAAVAQALDVLSDFYAHAGKAALVQSGAVQPAPEAFTSSSYSGMQSESGGVIGLIEVIQSDFARLEAETTNAERAAAAEYEEFMEDSKLDVTAKDKDVEHKTARKEDEERKLKEKQLDLQGVEKELDAAMKTYEELKPQCADLNPTFEERKAERDQKIASLQESLEALRASR